MKNKSCTSKFGRGATWHLILGCKLGSGPNSFSKGEGRLHPTDFQHCNYLHACVHVLCVYVRACACACTSLSVCVHVCVCLVCVCVCTCVCVCVGVYVCVCMRVSWTVFRINCYLHYLFLRVRKLL